MPRPGLVINSLLRRTGYRVVSVGPRAVRLVEERERAAGNFFPAGTPVSPWPIPEELAASPVRWHKVLCDVYRRPGSWPASISPEAGMFLHALVKNVRPKRVIETGTCLGVSTIWMAAALEAGAMVHTFDEFTLPTVPRLANAPIFQQRPKSVQDRFVRAGVADRITIHVGDSSTNVRRFADELRAEGAGKGEGDEAAGLVQLAFLDGDHSPKGAAADFQAVEPLLPRGGYIVLHDTFPALCGHTGPRYVLDNLHEVAAGKYQVLDVYTAPANYGLAVLRKI